MVGNMNDARIMVTQIRNIAAQFKYDNQYEIPVPVLAQRMGNELQRYSQRAGIRPFCCMITLVGCDEEFGPQVYKIDPSGSAIGYKAVATGTKEQKDGKSKVEKENKGVNTAKVKADARASEKLN